MTLAHILNSPEITHTLAALPDDPQLAALREAHDAQGTRLAVARARPAALDARIATIDYELVDADEKARRTLLTERGLLREERLSLPTRLLEEGKRLAVAELAVLGQLTALILPHGQEAARELAPIEGAANHIRAQIVNVESSRLDTATKTERTAAHRARLAEAAPQARELNERIRLVEYGLKMIRGHVEQQYGAGVDPQNVGTYSPAATAFGRRVVRQIAPPAASGRAGATAWAT
jgi:hypothetical protein